MDVEESANIWKFKYSLQPETAIKNPNDPENAKYGPTNAGCILSESIIIVYLIYNTISIEAD